MLEDIKKWSDQLTSEYKIGLLQQAKDILRYRTVSNIGISEYYELGLFDRKIYPVTERCIGRKLSASIDKLLNHSIWRATANDKILNYSLLSHFEFPIPTTIATYNAGTARIGKEKIINTSEAFHQFLTQEEHFPIFIKPVHGANGHATFSLAKYDASQRTFESTNGATGELSTILSAGDNPKYLGLLIQSCLRPHPDIITTAGPSTSCIRVILVRDGQDVYIHRAFWKIARIHNITDNFSYGKHGNLLANVDVESGRVTRVINGLWPNVENQETHPDTKCRLIDFQLPDWQQAMEQCKQASHIFSGLSMQSWDVAFCEQGPVFVELNTEANLEIPQMLSEQAFIDDRLLKTLKKRGWKPD